MTDTDYAQLIEQLQDLIRTTIKYRDEYAYAPYSNYKVGCMLEVQNTSDRYAYSTLQFGANVENSSYGLTICAERAAICSAVSKGLHRIKKMIIVGDGGGPPCGACQQFIKEFVHNGDFPIISYNIRTKTATVWEAAELTKNCFSLAH